MKSMRSGSLLRIHTIRFRPVRFLWSDSRDRSFAKQFYKLLYFVALITIPPTMAQVDFARNAASFAVDLYKNCLDGRGDENVILSPLSIQTAVGLAYMGAGGETAKEMAIGLRFGDGGRSDVAKNFQAIIEQYGNSPMLKIANKVYVKTGYEMKDEFKKISTDQFHSEAENLNFSENTKSANKINGWVEDKTNNKIKDLIKPEMLSADTRMVLVNAIYFKGFWEHKFDPQATEKMDFWLNENDKVPVDMMTTKKHFKYGRFDDLDATALEMKYKDSDLSMLVILPNKKTGLSELEGKLQNFNLLDMTSNMYSEEVIVKFPKFKIEFEISLNDVLKKMGMGTMFSNAADFSNLLTSDEQLKVSDVVHKAFIEVNEEGAEAAAATAGIVRLKRSLSQIIEMDHPFLFFIVNSKRNYLFFSGAIKTFPSNENRPFADEL